MNPTVERLKLWADRPDVMVRELFGVTPDPIPDKVLRAFPHTPKIAMQACAGSAKTFTLAMLGWNFMLTRPKPKIGVTSESGPNLKANLWAELAKWRSRSPLLMQMFDSTATEIYHAGHRENWKIEARTWRQDADPSQAGNSLRGLHGDYVMWLLDETGAYPDSILPVAENIFSGSPIEAHIVQAGNPTHLAGPLYRAAVLAPQGEWKVFEITADPDDPDRTPRVSIEHARAQIAQYGADNPWVLVNIFGRFPPSSINSLIGPEEVRAAMNRKYQQYDIDHAGRILGVDVAREGLDRSVIFPRQGLVAFQPKIMRNVDGNVGAGQVARTWEDWDVDAVFVDNTGGYGASWIDALKTLNRAAIPVGFAENALDRRYYRRRSEMWFKMVEWIKAGGALPPTGCEDLIGELSAATYTFKGDALLLEDKDQIKARIGRSPDLADALALTFAAPVQRKQAALLPTGSKRDTDYDPFRDLIRAR